MVSGQWSVVSGQLSVVSCQWSVVSGQWSVVSGQWSVVSCQWSVVSGQWSVVSCQWSVVSGQLSVVSCRWSVVSGQWSVVRKSAIWSLFFPIRHPDDLTYLSLAPSPRRDTQIPKKQSYLDTEAELHSKGMLIAAQPDFSGRDCLFPCAEEEAEKSIAKCRGLFFIALETR